MNILPIVKDVLETLSFLTVIISVPIGVYQYVRLKRYETYNALDEKYLEFINLCFENPKLNIFDVPDQTPSSLNAQETKQELIAFTMLFSIFERAFIMYSDQSNKIKERQWEGWDDYIEHFCGRENFRTAWRISGTTFDSAYQNYMESQIQEGATNSLKKAPSNKSFKRTSR